MRRRAGILAIIFVAMMGGLLWWNAPTSLINITPSDVSRIVVFNGNTGNATTITDMTDIEYIVGNLNGVSLNKEKISLGYMGYSLRTTIYRSDGTVYKEFIINSNHTIRKDPFFYRDHSNSIDYAYIQERVK